MTNKPTIKDCMEQAQIFASAWGRVGGGVFGTTMGHATAEKEALEAMLRAALAAPAQPVTVPWENFPSYLIDHCEGDVISEEGLQFALSKMLSNPQYAPQPAAQAQEDVPDMFWDADDTENFAHEIQDIIDGYGPGEIVTIECAKRLPNFRAVVTRDGDGISYEYLEAANAAQQGEAT